MVQLKDIFKESEESVKLFSQLHKLQKEIHTLPKHNLLQTKL